MLTVLLATRNRAEILSRVLDRYCTLEAPLGGWNLVIVDNGSTDLTRDVIHSYKHRLRLIYLFEPQPGKNAALNTGLSSISGDLVLLTDDDAFPYPDWLVRMREAADTNCNYTIFCGTVVPLWQSSPNLNLLSLVPLGPVFTVTDSTVPEGPTGAHNVFGPNMAIRAEVFACGYRFDAHIGPRGSDYPMGSETEFVRRLTKNGFMIWHCPRAVVEHFIPRAHMRLSWILNRAIRFGRGQFRLGQLEQGEVFPSWLGVPRYLFRAMLVEQICILTALLRFDRGKLFRARWQFNYLLGQLIEARSMRDEISGRGVSRSSILK